MSATVREGPEEGQESPEGAKPQPGDAAHGALVLEHAYHIEQRLETGPFFATYSARQTPFDRRVQVRFYEGLMELGLPAAGLARVRAVLERGGDGGLAVDVGELESGDPFLVVRPPPGRPLAEWWAAQPAGAARAAALVRALLALRQGATAAQRRELALERVYADGEDEDGLPRLHLRALGDFPTRAEVRQMTGLVTPELVRGFPPECFLPGNADAEGLEDTEAADVWRLGAVVAHVHTGAHPFFADGGDVAERVAELVGTFAESPTPPPTGSAELDDVLGRALQLTPDGRPTLGELEAAAAAVGGGPALAGAGAAGARGAASAGGSGARHPSSPEVEEEQARGSGLPRLFRGLVALTALVAVAVGTYLVTNQPPSEVAVIITSEPAGVRFERLTAEGEAISLGRSPILLENEPIDASITLRPLYEDGEPGPTHELTPERLEVFEACRRLHVRFE